MSPEAISLSWPLLVAIAALIGGGFGAATWLSAQFARFSDRADGQLAKVAKAADDRMQTVLEAVEEKVGELRSDLSAFQSEVRSDSAMMVKTVNEEHAKIRERLATVETIVARYRPNGSAKPAGSRD